MAAAGNSILRDVRIAVQDQPAQHAAFLHSLWNFDASSRTESLGQAATTAGGSGFLPRDGFLFSKATLIVVTDSTVGQWQREIETWTRRGRKLCCYVYPGTKHLAAASQNLDAVGLAGACTGVVDSSAAPEIPIVDRLSMESLLCLCAADVVLVSYNAIKADIGGHHHPQSVSSLRKLGRRSNAGAGGGGERHIVSPLFLVHFWRIIFDEIQSVQTGSVSACSSLPTSHLDLDVPALQSKLPDLATGALALRGTFRWVVSGTPLRDVDALRIVLAFLRHRPFGLNEFWKKVLAPALAWGAASMHSEKAASLAPSNRPGRPRSVAPSKRPNQFFRAQAATTTSSEEVTPVSVAVCIEPVGLVDLEAPSGSRRRDSEAGGLADAESVTDSVAEGADARAADFDDLSPSTRTPFAAKKARGDDDTDSIASDHPSPRDFFDHHPLDLGTDTLVAGDAPTPLRLTRSARGALNTGIDTYGSRASRAPHSSQAEMTATARLKKTPRRDSSISASTAQKKRKSNLQSPLTVGSVAPSPCVARFGSGHNLLRAVLQPLVWRVTRAMSEVHLPHVMHVAVLVSLGVAEAQFVAELEKSLAKSLLQHLDAAIACSASGGVRSTRQLHSLAVHAAVSTPLPASLRNKDSDALIQLLNACLFPFDSLSVCMGISKKFSGGGSGGKFSELMNNLVGQAADVVDTVKINVYRIHVTLGAASERIARLLNPELGVFAHVQEEGYSGVVVGCDRDAEYDSAQLSLDRTAAGPWWLSAQSHYETGWKLSSKHVISRSSFSAESGVNKAWMRLDCAALTGLQAVFLVLGKPENAKAAALALTSGVANPLIGAGKRVHMISALTIAHVALYRALPGYAASKKPLAATAPVSIDTSDGSSGPASSSASEVPAEPTATPSIEFALRHFPDFDERAAWSKWCDVVDHFVLRVARISFPPRHSSFSEFSDDVWDRASLEAAEEAAEREVLAGASGAHAASPPLVSSLMRDGFPDSPLDPTFGRGVISVTKSIKVMSNALFKLAGLREVQERLFWCETLANFLREAFSSSCPLSDSRLILQRRCDVFHELPALIAKFAPRIKSRYRWRRCKTCCGISIDYVEYVLFEVEDGKSEHVAASVPLMTVADARLPSTDDLAPASKRSVFDSAHPKTIDMVYASTCGVHLLHHLSSASRCQCHIPSPGSNRIPALLKELEQRRLLPSVKAALAGNSWLHDNYRNELPPQWYHRAKGGVVVATAAVAAVDLEKDDARADVAHCRGDDGASSSGSQKQARVISVSAASAAQRSRAATALRRSCSLYTSHETWKADPCFYWTGEQCLSTCNSLVLAAIPIIDNIFEFIRMGREACDRCSELIQLRLDVRASSATFRLPDHIEAQLLDLGGASAAASSSVDQSVALLRAYSSALKEQLQDKLSELSVAETQLRYKRSMFEMLRQLELQVGDDAPKFGTAASAAPEPILVEYAPDDASAADIDICPAASDSVPRPASAISVIAEGELPSRAELDAESSRESAANSLCRQVSNDGEDEVVDALACKICLENVLEDPLSVPCLTPCGHTFHESCILTWFSVGVGSNTCPVCKRSRLRDQDLQRVTPRIASGSEKTCARFDDYCRAMLIHELVPDYEGGEIASAANSSSSSSASAAFATTAAVAAAAAPPCSSPSAAPEDGGQSAWISSLPAVPGIASAGSVNVALSHHHLLSRYGTKLAAALSRVSLLPRDEKAIIVSSDQRVLDLAEAALSRVALLGLMPPPSAAGQSAGLQAWDIASFGSNRARRDASSGFRVGPSAASSFSSSAPAAPGCIRHVMLRGSPSARKAAVDLFREDPDVRVLLLHAHTDCSGVTLTAANHVFVLSAAVPPATMRQLVGRVCRMGQRRECFIYHLVAAGTVEQALLRYRYAPSQQLHLQQQQHGRYGGDEDAALSSSASASASASGGWGVSTASSAASDEDGREYGRESLRALQPQQQQQQQQQQQHRYPTLPTDDGGEGAELTALWHVLLLRAQALSAQQQQQQQQSAQQ